jgi:hypothetical protein
MKHNKSLKYSKTPTPKQPSEQPTPYRDSYNRNNKYNNSSIYKLKYTDCPLQYTGQTGRSFQTRFKENTRKIKHNKDTLAYTQHILNTRHTYKNLQNTMERQTYEQTRKIPHLVFIPTK